MKTSLSQHNNQGWISTGAFTRLVLITGLICSALFAVSATTSPNPATAESKKTIREYFKFPQILVTRHDLKNATDNTVEVLFTTNEKGAVNFALAKTSDEALKSEVEKQFYKLYLPKLKSEVVHCVVLRFKTL